MAAPFFIAKDHKQSSYKELLRAVSAVKSINKVIRNSDPIELFTILLASIVHGQPVIMLDTDFSIDELNNLGLDPEVIQEEVPVPDTEIASLDELIRLCKARATWSITLFTSGTTGIPKKVTHDLGSLTRLVRTSEKHANDVWGYAYNPTHIAGIQVFFQAFMNKNTMVDLFNLPRADILDRVGQYSITNISATPTFFRLLLPPSGPYVSVRRLTSGGEKFDPLVTELLQKTFPNAQFRNIYASTEAGSVLESRDDVFTITDESLTKIQDGSLWLNRSVLGAFGNVEDWYDTGDLVEIISTQPDTFRFISRSNEMINVGGYKVNPNEVEEVLNSYPGVLRSRVYGKPHALLGSVLLADTVTEHDLNEKDIRDYLSDRLQAFKVPRIINFVDNIQITRTGKIKRT